MLKEKGFTPIQIKTLYGRSYKFVSGFTLLEVLMVVLILGILATLSIPTINRMKARAIEGEAYMMFSIIKQAQELYHMEYDVYISLANAANQGTTDEWNRLGLENPRLNNEHKFYYMVAPYNDPDYFSIIADNKNPLDYGLVFHRIQYSSYTGETTITRE